MRMGQTLRYSSSKDPGPPMVDGLANFWHETIAPDGTRTQLEAGISPIGMVRAVDGRRTPAILLRSSPHKAGSEVTPWQDLFDPNHGHIRYYGDSKPTSQVPAEASPGNKALLEAFALHAAGTATERAGAAPLLCFRGVPVAGAAKGHVQFCGVGVLWRAERVAQWDAKTARSFANYRFDIVVLSLAAEDEQLDWAWINRRRDPGAATADCLQLAPQAWRDWVRGGAAALPRLRRSLARLRTVGQAAQLPVAGSREAAALQQVLAFYAGRKHRFEALAELVAERVLRGQGADYRPGWLTPASSDGGADFVGRLDVGDGFARAPLVVLGQAKCELGATSGLHLARTVARLRRGWLGVFVTTGFFSLPAQREALDDQYPLVLIHGLRVAEEVLRLAFERHGADVTALLEAVDATYQDRLQLRRPEEILWD
jgi:Restriction endonuclease AspBHI N-terminal/Restriction endonuclease